MSAQAAAETQPNGVVRPQGAERMYGSMEQATVSGAVTAQLQTADSANGEVQVRVQTREAGSLQNDDDDAAKLAGGETADVTEDMQVDAVGSSTVTGLAAQETQTGEQIRLPYTKIKYGLADSWCGSCENWDSGAVARLQGQFRMAPHGGGVRQDGALDGIELLVEMYLGMNLVMVYLLMSTTTAAKQPTLPVPPVVGPGVDSEVKTSGVPLRGHEGIGVIEALAQSMRQIQELQVQAMTKDGGDAESPEAVKTAVTTLPGLGVPEGDQCGLQFQDWVIQVTTAMQDLSTSSGTWWEQVKAKVVVAYSRWLAAAPLERLSIEPDGTGELVSGRYLRINARSCAMVIQAVPEAIKTDLISRRATQSMPMLLFRLYTLYQPGGAGERAIILQRLQGGERSTTTEDCLRQLRSWPRWVQRCQDMGMAVPDGTVLARGLTNLTQGAIHQSPDALFRTQLVRATLRIDQQPALSDVMKYQQHLQAEIENISTLGACKYFIKAGGCRRGLKSAWCAVQKIIVNAIAQPRRGGSTGEPESETSPKSVASIEPAQGQPVLSWEALLQAAAKVAGVPPEAKAPSLRVLSIHGFPEDDVRGGGAYALVDSGATHPLRRATTQQEWNAASTVVVHLAGGEVVELKMNAAGTLLVPCAGTTRTTSTAPIVPLGSLVGILGYSMEWHGSRCRLVGRDGEILNLRVRDGCPEITERQALDLISRIEDKKLEDLKTATVSTKSKIRESVMALNRTWFDHLVSYCRSGIGAEAQYAVRDAPFFDEVPKEALYGLSEADPISNGWEALKGFKHLNRRTRKKLWVSRNWVLHLYAGKPPNEEILFLERQGFAVLELDLQRGLEGSRQLWEEYLYGGWYGQAPKELELVNRHTSLFVKMIYIHALATAGRCVYPPEPNDVKEVGFMLEQPRDPRTYLSFSHPLVEDSVSFWRTGLWIQYAEEAGLTTYSFDMSSLGKALARHTTVGTNLPLRHLHGLRGRIQRDAQPPVKAPPSVWTKEFSETVSIAIREQRVSPRMLKMSAEQWKEHVRRGHLPFRSDCTTCVTAGATGRRHARVEHPSCFVLSADVSGPLKIPGLDADARGAFPKPHKYMFVAKLKVPKTFLDDGRGVCVDYDPGELEADVEPGEDAFDYVEPLVEHAPGEGHGDGGPEHQEDQPDDDGQEDGEEDDQPGQKVSPEEELDMTGPDTVSLIFATAMQDNKGATVLEAIQDVVMYCWSLNIPIVRFHCDRGMEFYAKNFVDWCKASSASLATSNFNGSFNAEGDYFGYGNSVGCAIWNQGLGQKKRVWRDRRAGET
ncbi:TY5A [Symbiodinium sp. CCMP2456]|nr:TY5A [Symbiodinium sp. CCMP2456]